MIFIIDFFLGFLVLFLLKIYGNVLIGFVIGFLNFLDVDFG